jgi:hypothetical protein
MTTINFDNVGFYQTKLTEQDLYFIKQEIDSIQSKFNTPLPVTMNAILAGNIAREYDLSAECKSHINNMLQPHLKSYVDTITKTPNSSQFSICKAWVNFQRKYEFNPVHDHTESWSFVIWMKIPYSMENEKNNNSVKYSNNPVAGAFSFLYTNCLGEISTHIIPADITYEGTLLVFPARLKHCVYPFYTSDEYRISVSGNFKS